MFCPNLEKSSLLAVRAKDHVLVFLPGNIFLRNAAFSDFAARDRRLRGKGRTHEAQGRAREHAHTGAGLLKAGPLGSLSPSTERLFVNCLAIGRRAKREVRSTNGEVKANGNIAAWTSKMIPEDIKVNSV